MNGVLGLHIIGDTGGSNENAVAFARQLGGRFCTIVNSDWKLYAPLLDSGIEVIARIKNDDWNDDDADNHQTGKAWASHLHDVYPDTRIYLTAGNELGEHTEARTQAWMVEFVEEAARLGHRTAGYHSHFLSPYTGYWKTQTRGLDALKAHKGMVCVHKGFAAAFRDMPALRGQRAIDEDFSRILEILAYRLPVVVTEFTGSLSPDRGWEFLYNNDAQAALTEADLGLKWLAEHGVYATYFTWWKWHNGEGFELTGEAQHRKDFRAGLININRKYPVKDVPMTQPIPAPTVGGKKAALAVMPSTFVNVRAQPNGEDVGDLLIGDEVTLYENVPPAAAGWVYVDPITQVPRTGSLKPAAKGWVSLQGGKVQFVPELLPPDAYITYPEAQISDIYSTVETAYDKIKELQQLLRTITDTLDKGVPSSDGGGF